MLGNGWSPWSQRAVPTLMVPWLWHAAGSSQSRGTQCDSCALWDTNYLLCTVQNQWKCCKGLWPPAGKHSGVLFTDRKGNFPASTLQLRRPAGLLAQPCLEEWRHKGREPKISCWALGTSLEYKRYEFTYTTPAKRREEGTAHIKNGLDAHLRKQLQL